ncbi:unnamed protein product [Durusdinium trenchii]|uniref:C3H1-type domain-containing protein n=1 Tax=Durusdinium trenchii TaxID=1381693 RepID=A0ABP0PCN1_9DINO
MDDVDAEGGSLTGPRSSPPIPLMAMKRMRMPFLRPDDAAEGASVSRPEEKWPGKKATQNKIPLQSTCETLEAPAKEVERSEEAGDAGSDLSEDVFHQELCGEEMISLALGAPEHWSLNCRPSAQERSHEDGTCVPCVFYTISKRCHFGKSCGCCHASSHRDPQTLSRFRTARNLKSALHLQRRVYKMSSAQENGRHGLGSADASASSSTTATAGSHRQPEMEPWTRCRPWG